jgi:hypothetical protein
MGNMRKKIQERKNEARETRKKYKHWSEVLKEGCWKRCHGCGKHVFLKGNMEGKTCRKCGTPLA